MLAAGDTFRAGAIEQLQVWGDRVGVEVIRQSEGSDPQQWFMMQSMRLRIKM